MNRNQPYDRANRDRYQNGSSRQSEQFADSDRDYGDDNRSYGQMGEGGSRESYGEYESEGYGSRSGWAGDRSRSTYDRNRDDRQRSAYSEQGQGSSSGGYSPSRYSGNERSGFDSFTSNDFGGRDFSSSRRNYGVGNSSSESYGGYGAGASGGSYGRSSGGYGSNDRSSSNDRGFFERAGDEVASWFGDDDAARRREQDHRGRGPANYTRSDERILEDACDKLTEDWGVDASSIQVTVQSGEVTLDGTVPSREQKRRAEDCVDDLSGVKHVQNNLRVQQSGNRSGTSNQSSSNQSLSESSYDQTDNTSGTLA